jgi:predicted NBD/HSP70 family sugar kinase/transcriptional regulator with XRE-family HTH domain
VTESTSPHEGRDDLDELLSEIIHDDGAGSAFHDSMRRRALLKGGREFREAIGRTQAEVAQSMGTSQSAISDLESGDGDPQLSTIQRYARSIDRRLDLALVDRRTPVIDEDTVRDIWRLTERRLLRLVLTELMVRPDDHGEDTRKSLAELAQLPVRVLDNSLNDLISKGWLTRAAGGARIDVNSARARVIGISVRAESIKLVVTDLGLRKIYFEKDAILRTGTPTSVLNKISQMVNGAVAFVTDSGDTLLGVGLALAGVVEGSTGTVIFAPNLRDAWTSVPMEAMLEERLPGFLVVVENDANALATRDYLHTGDNYIVTLLVTDGLGSSMLVDGRVLYGKENAAGELGHVVVMPNGERCRCGRHGCLETVVSEGALLREINKKTDSEFQNLAAATSTLVMTRQVLNVFRSAGVALGSELASMIAGSNPRQIVLYGPPDFVDADRPSSEAFFEGVKKGLSRQFFTKSEDAIRPRPLDQAVLALSGAAAVVREFLRKPWHWAPSIGGGQDGEETSGDDHFGGEQ